MTATRTCLACGYDGHDVRMTLVEHDDPLPVTVSLPVTHREGAVEFPMEVPGRYGAEWRCTDKAACRERALALEPMQPDPAEPAGAPDEFVLP